MVTQRSERQPKAVMAMGRCEAIAVVKGAETQPTQTCYLESGYQKTVEVVHWAQDIINRCWAEKMNALKRNHLHLSRDQGRDKICGVALVQDGMATVD